MKALLQCHCFLLKGADCKGLKGVRSVSKAPKVRYGLYDLTYMPQAIDPLFRASSNLIAKIRSWLLSLQ